MLLLTSLSTLDAAQCQDVLLVGQELPHLVEGLLAAHGQLAPGLGPGQDLADRALRQAQHVVAEDALADVVLDELLLHLPRDLRRVHVLALRGAAGAFRAAGRGRRAVGGVRAGGGRLAGQRAGREGVGVRPREEQRRVLKRLAVEAVHELPLEQRAQRHLARQGGQWARAQTLHARGEEVREGVRAVGAERGGGLGGGAGAPREHQELGGRGRRRATQRGGARDGRGRKSLVSVP